MADHNVGLRATFVHADGTEYTVLLKGPRSVYDEMALIDIKDEEVEQNVTCIAIEHWRRKEEQPRNRLEFDDFGPIQAQIAEVGGVPDGDGMVRVVLRCTVEDVRKFGEGLFRWGECTFSSVRIEENEDG